MARSQTASVSRELLRQKADHPPPSILRRLPVVDFRTRVVEKGVVGTGVDHHLPLFAVTPQSLAQPLHFTCRYPLVELRPYEQNRRAQLLQHIIRRRIAVEWSRRANR